VHPVDDIHAPASYRRRLAQTLARRALELAEARARKEATR
jgi:CO/xanthine dehydrogenase FAD-binding subunit